MIGRSFFFPTSHEYWHLVHHRLVFPPTPEAYFLRARVQKPDLPPPTCVFPFLYFASSLPCTQCWHFNSGCQRQVVLSRAKKKRKKKNITLRRSCVSLWLSTIESTMWDCSGLAACQQLWGVSTEARPLTIPGWILPIPTQLWNVSETLHPVDSLRLQSRDTPYTEQQVRSLYWLQEV